MRRFILAVAAFVSAVMAPIAMAAPDPFDRSRDLVIAEKNEEAIELIDSGQFDINQPSSEGSTLLHYAASAGNLPMVRELLARGANPTIKSKYGATAFDYASGTMVKAELARAMQAWNDRSIGSEAALPSAAAPSSPAPAQASNGMCAAVRAENVNDGRSPTLRPWLKARDDIWYSNPDELAMLLDDCVDANFKDDAGWTLLMIAADRDKADAARILLTHGASCRVTNTHGDTPASLAKSPEMKGLLASCPTAKPKVAAKPAGSKGDKKQCQALYQADAALCSDLSCKLGAQRKWQKCLDTGTYW